MFCSVVVGFCCVFFCFAFFKKNCHREENTVRTVIRVSKPTNSKKKCPFRLIENAIWVCFFFFLVGGCFLYLLYVLGGVFTCTLHRHNNT